MTKQQAISAICQLPYGTLGTLTGLRRYDELDQATAELIDKINATDVSSATKWQEVWKLCAR